jgi:hypothetical protein
VRLARTLLWLTAATLVAGLVVPSVAAKEGVVARVLKPIPRDAEPGSAITVAWTLSYVEEGKRHPFGGGGVFVRFIGPDGARSRRAYAANPEPGRFRATVRVPRGGVARVVIGIMGTVCDAERRPGCQPSPKHFPIVGRVFR